MIPKHPKKRFVQARFGLKLFLITEGILFVGTYLLYAACNRSQNTRKFFHDTPYLRFVLNFYYKTGELCGTDAVKKFDQTTWAAQAKLKEGTNQIIDEKYDIRK